MIMKTKLPLLKIDPDFQSLAPPLNATAYEDLELDIVCNGCQEPIKVWREFIIDGHNRYKICHEYDIDFRVEEIELKSKDDAISWICANLLDNRDVTENYRRYLIGRLYYAVRTVGIMNITGTNQYTIEPMERKPHYGKSAAKVGMDYHISHSTVSKYLQYSKAIDRFKVEFPNLANGILYETIKVSQDSIILLAKMDREDIAQILANTADKGRILLQDIEGESYPIEDKSNSLGIKGTVKEMPAFDPDGYVSSLALTIPSWISNMERAEKNSEVKMLSLKARYDLINALENLISTSTAIKRIMEEKD